MIPDCAFFTGSTHQVCQDYARHGKTEQGPYVLIADGCSSSPDSDIGARLLVMAAERCIDTSDLYSYHEKTIELAAAYARSMGLADQCLDATLLTLRIDNGVPTAMVYGDGYIATRKDGILKVTKIFFSNNTPLYLNYKIKPARLVSAKMVPALFENMEFGPEETRVDPERALNAEFLVQRAEPGADFIAIMSDGAGSFLKPIPSETSKTNESVDQFDILPELLAFKTFQPGFVQRRLKRLEKDNRERGWQHHDDLSVGAIYLKG